MATIYTYHKNTVDLSNNVQSAGLFPSSLGLIDSASVSFAAPLSVSDKSNLDQAMTDSGYDFDSQATGPGGSYVLLTGNVSTPGLSPAGSAWLWFDSFLGELRVSLSGGAAASLVTAPTGSLTLQDAYDNGSTINLAAATPVTLNKTVADASNALAVSVTNGSGAGVSIALTGSATGPAAVFTGGNVGVGTTSPNSRLHVNGSFAVGFRAVSANAVALLTDCVISADASGGDLTITLPSAVGTTGRTYYIKRTDNVIANTVYVQAAGAETIDGGNIQQLLVQYEAMQVVSTGSGWLKI